MEAIALTYTIGIFYSSTDKLLHRLLGLLFIKYAMFIHSFIHSGDLYSASSRDYCSEALPAQPRTKKKDLREM